MPFNHYLFVLLFFLVTFCLVSCSGFLHGIRDRYYRKSLESYKFEDKLAIGDSVTVMFGDTLSFWYSRRKLGAETGALIITKNQFNKIEYYEIGEWKDYWAPQFVGIQSHFDLKRGMYQSKGWNPDLQGEPLLSFESNRHVEGDSLIETIQEYYENGQLKENSYYLIHKGFHRKHRQWEKRTKIGTWIYYTEQGQVKKTKVYSK